MQRLQPPKPFSFKPEEWLHWKKQFRRYRNASKLSADNGVTQRDTFLYVMGEESEKIFESLNFETVTIGDGPEARQVQEDEDFEMLVAKFDDYFLVKRNIIYERTKFQERKQQSVETVEEFYRALRALVAHCEYNDTEDQVRDRFVVGLKDCRLKEKLQLIRDLNLAKALEIARQHEQIKEQMKQQGENVTAEETRFMRGRSRFRGTGRYSNNRGNSGCDWGQSQRGRMQSQRGRGQSVFQQQREKQIYPCGRCSRVHKKEEYCPARGQICHTCHRKGHFARMCKSGVREVNTDYTEDLDAEEDTYMLDSVITDNSEPWKTKLKIKGVDVTFKIDTGADVTIINETTFESFKNRPKLSSTRMTLTSPGGKLSVKGEFFAKTVVKNKTFKFRVIVVRNRSGCNLLSRTAAEKLGLVKRVDEIHRNMFGRTGLLITEPVKISMKPDSKPYCVTTARRVPFPLRKKVKAEIDRMLADGIIQEVKEATDWCAPMVPVVKPNGSVRICVDFKRLNETVKRPHFMLPNLDDIAPQLSGSKYFTTLDASSGFFQIPLAEESMLLTTFITPFGRFAFKRVPMGISLGPECFQRKMEETLHGLEGCECIMDDTIVYGRTEEEHDSRLDAVLKRIEEKGLKLNKQKCQFKKSEVKFFGHNINEKGVQPDPEKVKAITEMPPPTSVSELRTICGMFNYFSRFVPGLATVMKPITDLLKKDTSWSWGPVQEDVFQKIKKKLLSTPALGFYSLDRKTVVSADSSSYGLGAALMQWNGNILVPIAYASRTLTDSERRYAQIEKECLASTWACEKFSKYLIGLDRFQLQTDHKPLVPLIKNKDIDKTPVRCQRLLIRLMRFNVDVIHVLGKQIVIADALSRSPVPHTHDDENKAQTVTVYANAVESSWSVTPRRLHLLRSATVHDPELRHVIGYVLNGWPTQCPSNLQAYHQVQGELSVVNGLLVYNDRIVVPHSQRQEILHKLHETHQGLHKCRQNAQTAVWWPGLSRDLKELLDACQVCRMNRPSQRNEPLRPTPLPERPWQRLGADLCTYQGKDHLVVVDYYSRWIEILPLVSTTARVIIKKLKQLFATHGVPDIIISDNRPQFQCEEFRQFSRDYDFHHQTSSPCFPQANGAAESAVKVAKGLLKQSSLDLALLNYRATPHSSTGVSPAVALMGRPLKTKLPRLPEQLSLQPVRDVDIRRADQKTKDSYKLSYDRRHGVQPLSLLKPGDQVRIKTDGESGWNKQGTIVAGDPQNRTYLINSPAGILRRNRKHLQHQKVLSPKCMSFPDHPPSVPLASTPAADSEDVGDSGDSGRDEVRLPDQPGPMTRSRMGYKLPSPFDSRNRQTSLF